MTPFGSRFSSSSFRLKGAAFPWAVQSGRQREANAAEIDAVLAETADRPIVEVSTRDPWWGARPVADRFEGHNVLGRLWMELRQQLRENDPAARSGAWIGRIRVGCLAGDAPLAQAAPQNA